MKFNKKALIAAMAIVVSTQQFAFADSAEMQDMEVYLKGVLGENTHQVSQQVQQSSKDGKSVQVVKYKENGDNKAKNSETTQVVNTVKDEKLDVKTPALTKKEEIKALESEMKKITGESSTDKSSKNSAVVEVDSSKVKKSKQDPIVNLDGIFMKNLPEGTKFTAKKDFVVLPKRNFIIFSNGERVIESPQKANPLTTFCYIELNPSGRARILKEDKEIVVTKNEIIESIYENPQEAWRGRIKVYESKLYTDNPSIKYFSCYSAYPENKSNIPLTLKDFNTQTGNSFKIDFPAYEEI